MSLEGFDGLELVSLVDIGMAYRKVKVDAFYFQIANKIEFLEYEENLEENLESLYARVNNFGVPLSLDVGTWTVFPKKAKLNNTDSKEELIYSDPKMTWKHGKCKEVTFRLMARPNIDFYVFSAIWMAKIGHKFDKKLDDCSYGNRFRRKKNKEVNEYSLGSFNPYIKPFKDWRDNGLKAMRQALDDGKPTIAITADISNFYHKLDPSFMLSDEFISIIELNLDDGESLLNEIFIEHLIKWAESTPLKKGLPVGLPASAVIANMALIELDRIIESELTPLYYGRYVDDILLVLENKAELNSVKAIWEWVFSRLNHSLTLESDGSIEFKAPYLVDSEIKFKKEKTKVFILDGVTGYSLIDSLEKQIQERASEWRALPNLPSNSDHVAASIVSAIQSDGEAADNLRKADSLSIRKAGFAIKLRDFEAYERDLFPADWKEHRVAFYHAYTQQVLVLPTFVELFQYFPRVIQLAASCEDFEELSDILKRLDKLVIEMKENCDLSIASHISGKLDSNDLIVRWEDELKRIVNESIKIAIPNRLTKKGKKDWEVFINLELAFIDEVDIRVLQKIRNRLFMHDLAKVPFRYIALPKELSGHRNFPSKKEIKSLSGADNYVRQIAIGLGIITKLLKLKDNEGIPFGFLFSTRPFRLVELNFLFLNPFSKQSVDDIANAIFSLRGFSIEHKLPIFDKTKRFLEIERSNKKKKVNIAIASWKTNEKSWISSVTRKTDPDTKRYSRLNKLLSNVMASYPSIDYLIMPEVSVPAAWFMSISLKLQSKGISLIAGIEYLHKRGKTVRNQVWASLCHDSLGFPSFTIYKQDKQKPALHEEQELFRLAGVILRPDSHSTWKTPPVICHGGFQFSILVCSELTNIKYRSSLRGKIDALFVPEWNPDTTSFSSLVESAALDIHSFVIQANDRQYGDSRIRAPYKDQWKRDIVRVKGGKNDYFVVGEIDIEALRKFQSSYRSPDKPFKPVPDGFLNDMDFRRKVLPSGDGRK